MEGDKSFLTSSVAIQKSGNEVIVTSDRQEVIMMQFERNSEPLWRVVGTYNSVNWQANLRVYPVNTLELSLVFHFLYSQRVFQIHPSLGPRPHPYTGKRVWCTWSDFLGLTMWQF